MKITVLVSTLNRGPAIRETLESLAASAMPDFAVVVVNQSTDGTTGPVVDEFAAADPRFRHVPTPTRGLSKARNLGLREAAGADVVVFTDDDCRVDPYWIGALAEEFERRPDVAGVFGRVLPDGPSASGMYLAIKEDPQREEFIGKVDVYAGHGANMAFRLGVLEEAGGFDEALGAGGPLFSSEDLDIRVRLLDRGHRLVYLPSAIVYHKQDRPWERIRPILRSYAKGSGACFAKYMRCGRVYGLTMLLVWFWKLGVRELVVGGLRLNRRRILNGWYQLWYPWAGLLAGWRAPLDRPRMLFVPPSS